MYEVVYAGVIYGPTKSPRVRAGGPTKPHGLVTNVYDVSRVLMRKGRIVQVYEWFLDLPVAVVLVVLWLAGVGLVSLCALALYLCWILLRAVIGA